MRAYAECEWDHRLIYVSIIMPGSFKSLQVWIVSSTGVLILNQGSIYFLRMDFDMNVGFPGSQ